MQLPVIEPKAVKAALRSLRNAAAMTGTSLAGLAVVDARLRELGLQDTPANREWALVGLLSEMVWQQLTAARGRSSPRAPAAAGDVPADADRALAADFTANDTLREAWSAVFFRYVSPSPMAVQHMAAVSQPSLRHGTRQVARRVQRGIELLTDLLRSDEAQAQARLTGEHEPGMVRRRLARHNLPHRPSRFVGRAEALRDLARFVVEQRVVSLVGFGGIGKTRLAIRVALDALDAFPDGVWFVDLSTVTSGPGVVDAVARVLDVRSQTDAALPDALIAALGQRRLLVILDNCEHVVGASAAFVNRVAAECPNVAVLATSRQALGVAGEEVWPVPPLALPPASDEPTVDTAAASDAVALLVDRVTAVQPEFRLSPSNVADVVYLVEKLEGIPLAIELAAAWAFALPLGVIVEQIDDPLQALTRGPRSAPDRQRTLRAAIQWSYDLLTPAERQVFCALAVFHGGWTVEAVQAVCGTDDAPPEMIAVLHAALVARSLMAVDGAGGAPRYRLYEPVRQFAAEMWHRTPHVAHHRRQHAAYCLALSETAAPHLGDVDAAAWIHRLQADYDNIRAALRWCLEHDAVDWAQRIAAAIWMVWHELGLLTEGRSWLGAVLARTDLEHPPACAAMLLHAAGTLAIYQADHATARRLLEHSIDLSRAAGNDTLTLAALHNLAHPTFLEGDYAEARRLYEACVGLSRTLRRDRTTAIALSSLSMAEAEEGDLELARRHIRESLALAESIGDESLVAEALGFLGTLDLFEADTTDARYHLELALAMQTRLSEQWSLAQTLRDLVPVAILEGRLDHAEELARRSLDIARQHDNPWAIGEACIALGKVLLERDDRAGTRAALAEASPIVTHIGNAAGIGRVEQLSGTLALIEGDLPRARHHLLTSLSIHDARGLRPRVGADLTRLAALAAALEHHVLAVTLAAAADATPRYRSSPRVRALVDVAIEASCEALGDRAAAAARAAGGGMALRDAVALARTGLGDVSIAEPGAPPAAPPVVAPDPADLAAEARRVTARRATPRKSGRS